ncbi:hypothetical protein H1Q63_14495 [Desmonostoc muscorum CCALA 125]|nr:hypothetical protein [Desmonostoc muscorum CCALA 125]
MSNRSITTNKLSEVPLDLRASAFVILDKDKGSCWPKLTRLSLVECIPLSLVWVLPVYQSCYSYFTWDIASNYLKILISVEIQIILLVLEGNYREDQKGTS